jgi:iron complex outermembrane receptor protein
MLSVSARYSLINSDGYIDRASSKLRSFNINALFEKGNTKIRFLTFGGKEKTYQAWNGIDKATWETNPKFNYSGAIYDDNGNITSFYNNETDNYWQNHYHLLWEQNFLKNGILKQLFILRMEKVTTKITSKTLSFLNMICQILQKMEIQLPEQISLEKNG